MARDGMGSIVGIAAVAGLAYWAYSSGILGSLMGSTSAPAPAPPAKPNPGSGAGTTPVVPAVSAGPCSGAGVLASWLGYVQKARPYGADYGPDATGGLTIDEWCYYGNEKCTGICEQFKLTADGLFPGREDRGGVLNWNAFSGYAKQAGLSGTRRGMRGVTRGRILRRVA